MACNVAVLMLKIASCPQPLLQYEADGSVPVVAASAADLLSKFRNLKRMLPDCVGMDASLLNHPP
jgi:hypothetical protein